ncbi:MAG: DUF2165 family protein [Oleiphilaceae bacterium]|nr:DUF2165 family protein [Oleiphilaceae bacterium]
MDVIWLVKAIPLFGLSCWMLLAAANNLLDPNTNITLLHRMMSMQALQEDQHLGQGLLHRARAAQSAIPTLLKGIAIYQLILALGMLLCSLLMLLLVVGITPVATHTVLVLSALTMSGFMAMWLFFLVGGLWFGYWIKMGQVQFVHLSLLMISILFQILLVQGL